VHQLVKRYNANGVDSMRDRRHEHSGAARALDKAGEDELNAALQTRPADGGIWTSRKTAAWISGRLGRKVSTTSGWRTLRRLGHTPKRPRPRHKLSDPEAQEAFRNACRSGRPKYRAQHPEAVVETGERTSTGSG
jgi:transposase